MLDKEFLDLLIRSQEKIHDRLNEIEKTQVSHHETLRDHTRRSLANEENVALLRAEFKPVQQHVNQVQNILKIIGLIVAGIVGLAGFILTIIQIIKMV